LVAGGVTVREIDTPSGPARVHLSTPPRGAGSGGLFVVGHGAGGGIEAPDIVAVTRVLVAAGWTAARVEQPYRVKGRRAPEAAPRLDAAWQAVVREVRGRRRGPLVVAGRSSGARVACRTAAAVGADAVVALAFPLCPPGRPEKSRAGELLGLTVPCLVVQGDRDPFGAPADVRAAVSAAAAGGQCREAHDRVDLVTVHEVPGDHSLRRATAAIAVAVETWLTSILG
jgi:predicted alpha/beta-hydrolase family hydrolase